MNKHDTRTIMGVPSRAHQPLAFSPANPALLGEHPDEQECFMCCSTEAARASLKQKLHTTATRLRPE